MINDEYPSSPGGCDRLDDPCAPHPVVGGRKLGVLGGDQERFGHEVEVFYALCVLQALNVLIQSVFASKLVGSEK